MSESGKTMVFVGLGVLAVAAAYFIDRPTQSVNVATLVGKTLNTDFEVDAPKRLQIVKFDRTTAETKQFDVASVDGVWRIPSKQDYPADATQQMAAAANALIDRKILRVAAETAQAHEDLGVVDPQSAKLDSNSQGVGTRVVMSDGDDKTLVDMIIGKKVKDAEGQRYVRNSNQDVVYIVELDPESLSTNFEDWIEDDLLQLSPFDLRRVFINDYSADLSFGMSQDGRIVPQVSWDRRNEITLDFNNEESKWTLANLKGFDKLSKQMVEQQLPDDEEVNQEAINALRNGLDELLIVDIAKKPAGLSNDLKAGNDFMTNQEAFKDLVAKGFSPVPLKAGAPPEILSSEGELIATQRDGVEYVLRFGQLQVQTDSADGETPADAAATPEGEAAKPAGDQDGKNLRRYLFVMARFNEDAIEKPQLKELPPLPEGADAPAETAETPEASEEAGESEPPAESAPAEEETANPEAAGGDEPEAAQPNEPTDETDPADAAPAGEEAAAEETPAAAEAPAGDEAAEPEVPPAPTANDAIAAERAAIEEENKRLQDEYNATIAAGKKRVLQLNERFGDWYYVISNDVYKQIHLGRDQVFQKKGATPAGDEGQANPLQGLPNLPIGAPPTE